MNEPNKALLALLVPPAKAQEAKAFENDAVESLAEIQALPRETQADGDVINAAFIAARTQLALVEAAEQSITKPLRAAAAAVSKMFGAKKYLAQAIDILKEKMEATETDTIGQEQALREALLAGDEASAAMIKRVEFHAVRFDHYWEIASVDMEKVPRQYLVLGPAIHEHTKAFKKSLAIPAVEGVVFRRRAKPIAKPMKGDVRTDYIDTEGEPT